MKRTILSALIAVCCFSTATYADERKAMEGMNHDMSQMTMESSPNAQRAAYDHQFLDTMMHHHMMAIHMAEMAQSKASRKELKDKAKMMMEEQNKEIEELRSLKQKFYGDRGDAINMKLPGMMSMESMNMEGLMSAEGDAFDTKFIAMMIKHHHGGIAMAKSEITRGKQQEIKDLAKKIMDAQKKDIDELGRMKKAWGSKS